jgi:hypothetical protein
MGRRVNGGLLPGWRLKRPVPVQGGHAAAIVSVAGLNQSPVMAHSCYHGFQLSPGVSSRPPNIQGVDFLIARVASEDRRAVGATLS